MEEIWKPVKGFEGYYEVSNLGRVRSIDRVILDKNGRKQFKKGTVLNYRPDMQGYCIVSLSVNRHYTTKCVHTLVADAFIPNPENLPQVNHKDEDKSNNVVDNLEWCTAKYNANYGTRTQRWYDTRIRNGTIDPSHIGMRVKRLVI